MRKMGGNNSVRRHFMTTKFIIGKPGKMGVVHWSIVEQRGQDKEIKSGLFSNFRKEIQKEIDKVISDRILLPYHRIAPKPFSVI